MNKCKVTTEDLVSIMTFGKMPIANGFIEKKNFDKEFFFEMEIGFNEKLSLLQLIDHPKPEVMFNKNYPFFTSSSKYMISHFRDYSQWINQNYGSNLKKIIEIGSNDGTFLKNFKNTSIQSIGFEPSLNVSDEAIKQGINSKNSFFNLDSVEEEKKFQGQTDIICAANVICHIPDIENLFKSVDKCLNQKGLFIFEEPYLGSMFEKISYDQIYDEHIFMFSASSVQKICKLFNMELIDVVKQETHGGSLRYVCARKNTYDVKKKVSFYLSEESKNNLDNSNSCFQFKKNCENSKKNLINKLLTLKKDNKKICGYAATSKSTTILNYCGIGTEIIDFICDTTPEKIGKYSPGKHIPIKSMDYFYKNYPDIAFLFAWNHKNEIFAKEKEFSQRGKWIAHVEL
jgi:SAM-dependent methyltransferase